MSENESNVPESVEESYPKESYAWFVVGMLMIAYIFSFIDRQILSLLVEPTGVIHVNVRIFLTDAL